MGDRCPSRQADRAFGVPSAVRRRPARVGQRSRRRMGVARQHPHDGRGSPVQVQPGAGLAHGPVHRDRRAFGARVPAGTGRAGRGRPRPRRHREGRAGRRGPAARAGVHLTASCAHATGSCTCAAEGRTKNEAKTAAAAGLLDQITEQERSAAAQLARAAQAEARSARGIFGRLLRAGCALDFGDRRFEVTGPEGAALEGPLAGFTVRLLEALPVLATLDSPAADGSAALPHESARAWACAARSALEAVAARRVYPALDAAGRDCWRLAGSAADDGFTDAVAEALLRPPGARLVIGDLPYAGRARVLDGDA